MGIMLVKDFNLLKKRAQNAVSGLAQTNVSHLQGIELQHYFGESCIKQMFQDCYRIYIRDKPISATTHGLLDNASPP